LKRFVPVFGEGVKNRIGGTLFDADPMGEEAAWKLLGPRSVGSERLLRIVFLK
jgi:hypothetical protein